MSFSQRRRRFLAASLAGSTALGVVATVSAPAEAAVAMAPAVKVQTDADSAGVTAQGQTQARLGNTYRITGTHWCYGNKKVGQWVAVKLLNGTDDASPAITMDAAHTNIPMPDGTTQPLGARGVIAMLKASDDATGAGNCSLDATVTLPDTTNSNAKAADFADGAMKNLVLLGGSSGPAAANGAVAHAATLGMKVGAPVDAAAALSTRTVTMSGARLQGLPGQYRAAYSAKTGKLYVTSVVFPDDKTGAKTNGASTIGEVDPTTMRVLRGAVVNSEDFPASMVEYQPQFKGDKAQHAPFGIVADDARGLLWTSDTIHDTVSAYDMNTFELVWRSPAGSATHSRELKVLPSGDVIVSGMGGLWKVSGNRGSFQIAPFAITDKKATPMTIAQVGDQLYVNDASANKVSVIDPAAGKVTKEIPLSWPTPQQDYFHGQIGVDAGAGVIVAADQGAYDQATKGYKGAGVTFYTMDGTQLGHMDIGKQNVSVAVDTDKHVAYVADFGGTEVRAFDLTAAAKKAPALMGTATVAAPGSQNGVNSLSFVNGKLLAVTKDGSYKGVTIDYSADLKTGDRASMTSDADSLVMLSTAFADKPFNPATDATAVTAQGPAQDLSGLPLYPGATPPVVPAPAQTGSLDLAGLGGLLNPQMLGSVALLGIGGFIAGLLSGFFNNLLAGFGPR